MTSTVHGIHHTGLVTRDLDGLTRRFESFGFTSSPRSRHLLSERPGEPPVYGCTANQCILFGDSYIELLGIVDDSAPDPWHTARMGEGFRLINFETDDAAAAYERLNGSLPLGSGVLDLEREVDTEDGTRTVRARAVHLDPRSTPEGFVGIAQHLTRQYVHQPRYLEHANGARGLGSVLMVAADSDFEAILDRYALLLGAEPGREGPGAVLESGGARLVIVRASDAERVLPGEPVPGGSYPAAMTIVVDDLGRARRAVESGSVETRSTGNGFFVSARDAYGTGLFFTTAG
ncbi:VOC family protein [Nocardia sp. NPDC001965]